MRIRQVFWDMIAIANLAVVVVWLSVSSGHVMGIQAMQVVKGEVVFVRTLPYGGLNARSWEEIVRKGDGFQCGVPARISYYEKRQDDTVRYPLPDKCEWSDGDVYRSTWSVLVGGVLPLRPTTKAAVIRDS